MHDYVKVRDELSDAELEVKELSRLLKEAIARRDELFYSEQQYTIFEYILRFLGFQIKSN